MRQILDIQVNFTERERKRGREGRLGRDQNCKCGSPDISRGVGREDQQSDLYFPPCLIFQDLHLAIITVDMFLIFLFNNAKVELGSPC